MAVARSPFPAQPGENFSELVQVALDVAGSLNPRDVIARILERGTDAVQADRATLSSLLDSEVVIEATYGRGGQLTWVGQRYSLDFIRAQPLVQQAVDTLQPTFGGRLAVEQAAPEFRKALSGVQHVALIPLIDAARSVGLLVLSRYEDRPFTPADVAALTLLGTISGLALRNARLYEEGEAARQRADAAAAQLKSAVEAAEDVASQVELDQVLGRLLRRAAASVGADGASVARLEGSEMVIESTITGAAIGSRWPVAPAVLAGVRQGRPVELSAAEYTGTPAGLQPVVQPFQRFLITPLSVGGETIGLIAMGRKRDEPFDLSAVQGLQQFSTLGALLLRNARLIARAQEAERAKSEFMNTAVHELRAPLTVTDGYLQIALDGGFGELPPPLRDVLTTARRKTGEAKTLADELLTVARLEDRAITPKADRFSIDEAMQDAIARARPRAALVHAGLLQERAAGIEVQADRALVGKILDNLLNNALTYSVHPPSVRLAAHREGDRVVITVVDDGIGISATDRPRIFDRFVRGTDRAVLEKPGSGLGLYLSRGLAEQMGGSLELASTEPGKGSTFKLDLPSAGQATLR